MYMQYFREKYVHYALSCGVSYSKLERDRSVLLALERFYPKDIQPERYLEILKLNLPKFESLFFYRFLTLEIDRLYRLDNFLCTNVWIEVSDSTHRGQVAQYFKSAYLQRQLDFVYIHYGEYRLSMGMFNNLAMNRENIILEVPEGELWDSDLPHVIQTILNNSNLLLIMQMGERESEIISSFSEFEFAAFVDGTVILQTNTKHSNYIKKYGQVQKPQLPLYLSEKISSI